MNIRTDLACEAKVLRDNSADATSDLTGVKSSENTCKGYNITTVEIIDEHGSKELCKPIGKYVTVDINSLMQRSDNAFSDGTDVLSKQIKDILNISSDAPVLVAGLGNEEITPDAIGPLVVKDIIATRHLTSTMHDSFGALRSVTAIQTGVLGTTGIESAEIIQALVRNIRPAAVIAVDALVTMSLSRICRTVQISDSGIVPGSGVGNGRKELSKKTLGVPVVAVGVPTVVDAATVANEIYGGKKIKADEKAYEAYADMIVTPRDIDKNVSDISKLIAYSVNLALQDQLVISDIDMFLS